MDIIINASRDHIPQGTTELVSQGSPLIHLLTCLGYDSLNPPLADLLSKHYHLEGDWLILSPVQWHANHNNVVITALGMDSEIDENQLKMDFHSFSEHLMSVGMALYYHEPETWLLSTNHRSLLKAKPVHHILNKPLMLELVQLDDTMHWQKFLTESQMFFASLNNPSLINGVWLWGGGILGDKKRIKICADNEFLSIAQLCSTEVDLYNPDLPLREYELLLVQDLSVLSEMHQKQLEKMATRWYWNNAGYEYSHIHWFTRLWRKLVHAH
jgi:hypothetical protein